MNNSWDVPSIPDFGDLNSATTHAARSRSLDAWEHIELSLFLLDSTFARIIIGRVRYGEGLIFRQRITNLEDNARQYFVKYPNQQQEADFLSMVGTLKEASMRRHDIAHGIVAPWPRHPQIIEFALMPPFYQVDRQSCPVRFPTYVYNAEILMAFESRFLSLRERVSSFLDQLRKQSEGGRSAAAIPFDRGGGLPSALPPYRPLVIPAEGGIRGGDGSRPAAGWCVKRKPPLGANRRMG